MQKQWKHGQRAEICILLRAVLGVLTWPVLVPEAIRHRHLLTLLCRSLYPQQCSQFSQFAPRASRLFRSFHHVYAIIGLVTVCSRDATLCRFQALLCSASHGAVEEVY